MAYNSVTHKLDMWISNEEPTLNMIRARLRAYSHGYRWASMQPCTQGSAMNDLRASITFIYGTPGLLSGFAREALEDAYNAVDWAALTADYIDQIAEDEGN